MMAFAHAPSVAEAPELFARYSAVEALHLSWEDIGRRLTVVEVNLLIEMLNIYHEAQAMKTRAAARAR